MDTQNKNKNIYITKVDQERLRKLINEIPPNSKQYLELTDLITEIERAEVVESTEIPENVVTMNSRIDVVDIDTNKTMTLQLVYPDASDIEHGKISIFSPVGTAILGYKAGDIIEWQVPSGIKRLKIENIHYQPEASGDYHL
jgi:regulator of nucleoside diphosphate kinase